MPARGRVARCMLDTAPRRLSADKLRMLAGFADMAVRQLEKHMVLQRQLASSRRRAARMPRLRRTEWGIE